MNVARSKVARRLVAFAIDWMIIALWGGLLFGSVMLVTGGDPPRPQSPWTAQAISFMANAYLDILPSKNISPFFGLGIGGATVSIEDASVAGTPQDNVDDTVFAAQVMAGVAFSITDNIAIDGEYRFFFTDNTTFDGARAEYKGHGFNLGVRYTF